MDAQNPDCTFDALMSKHTTSEVEKIIQEAPLSPHSPSANFIEDSSYEPKVNLMQMLTESETPGETVPVVKEQLVAQSKRELSPSKCSPRMSRYSPIKYHTPRHVRTLQGKPSPIVKTSTLDRERRSSNFSPNSLDTTPNFRIAASTSTPFTGNDHPRSEFLDSSMPSGLNDSFLSMSQAMDSLWNQSSISSLTDRKIKILSLEKSPRRIGPKTPQAHSLTWSQNDTPTAMHLNFLYNTQMTLLGDSSLQTDGSDTSLSSSEDMELVCQFTNRDRRNYSIRPTDSNNIASSVANFEKQIPVPAPVPVNGVPRLLLNEKDNKEWKDVQDVYLKERVQGLCGSVSDTNISTIKKKSLLRKLRTPKLSSIVGRIKNRKSVSEHSGSFRLNNTPKSIHQARGYSSCCTLPGKMSKESLQAMEAHSTKFLQPHFTLAVNEPFIKVNTKSNPNFTAILYAELPTGFDSNQGKANMGLCHAKTELVVAALLSFFQPYKDIQCLWITDINGKVASLLRDDSLKPMFTRLVYLKQFDAILVLSNDASCLLRRKNSAFLHSLASVLQTSTNRILVLQRNPRPHIISSLKPVTTAKDF